MGGYFVHNYGIETCFEVIKVGVSSASSRLFHSLKVELVRKGVFKNDSSCKRNVDEKDWLCNEWELPASIVTMGWYFVNYFIECYYSYLFLSPFKCFQTSFIKSARLVLNLDRQLARRAGSN